MNFIILMGRLTADVQIKATQSGISLANFTLAVDRVTNGEKKADFLRCIAFKNIAENIGKYFGKGDSILIQGSVQTRNYNDFEGNQRIITEVIVDRFYFVSNKKSISNTEPTNSTMQAATQDFEYSSEKLNTSSTNRNIYNRKNHVNNIFSNQKIRNKFDFSKDENKILPSMIFENTKNSFQDTSNFTDNKSFHAQHSPLSNSPTSLAASNMAKSMDVLNKDKSMNSSIFENGIYDLNEKSISKNDFHNIKKPDLNNDSHILKSKENEHGDKENISEYKNINSSHNVFFKDNPIQSAPPKDQNTDKLSNNNPPEYKSDIEKLNGKGFTTLAQAIMKNSAKGLVANVPPHIIPNETRANHTPQYSMKNGFQIIDDNEGDLPF